MRARRESLTSTKRGDRSANPTIILKWLQTAKLEERARTERLKSRNACKSLQKSDAKLMSTTEQVENLKDRLTTPCAMADTTALLQEAIDLGAFEGKDNVLTIITDTCKNLKSEVATGSKNSARYSTSTKNLYETITIMGGPALHGLVSRNLNGPCLSTSAKQYKAKAWSYDGRIPDEKSGFWEWLRSRYEGFMTDASLSGRVPFEFAEGERATIPLVSWNPRTDEL